MSEELINSKFNFKSKFLWHSTQVYCLAFDRKGKYIFTGGDEGILRIYSVKHDKLLKELTDQNPQEYVKNVEEVCRNIDFNSEVEVNIETFLERFAISDIDVSHENTLVAVAKYNGSIIVWNLQTYEMVVKFEEQMFPIRSISFSSATFPSDRKYLISTSEDGFIFFYVYNSKTLVFEPKALHRRGKYDGDRAVNICVDLTPGGLLLGLIHTFGVKQEASKPKSKKELAETDIQTAIRIMSLNEETGVKEEWKSTYHKSHTDCVYSFRFARNTFRFATACDKDTNVFVWTFDKSNKKWDSIIIGINTKGNNKRQLLRGKQKKSIESVFVEEIVFTCDDKYMITTLTDSTIKVWNSESGELVKHFEKYHTMKISIVECHPIYGHIFMSAGYDSNVFIYDITGATILHHFDCRLSTPVIVGNCVNEESQVIRPLLLQCIFSPDGQTIGATDNFGNLFVFSLESKDTLDQLELYLSLMEDTESEEPGITPSEDESKLYKSMFDYESDLLKGLERISPTKLPILPVKEVKKSVENSVKKLDFENKSTEKSNKLKPNPIKAQNLKTKAIPKSAKKKTPPKKIIETTPHKEPEDDLVSNETEKPLSSTKSKAKPKDMIKQILNEIFENPSSRPFQINDEIQYPTYRKEISDADLSLTSIREEMLNNSRYSVQKFNKDMNNVLENAKNFYKHIDEEVYDLALILEKFYCNKMETHFGTIFKPPLSCDSSDESDVESTEDKKTIVDNLLAKEQKIESILKTKRMEKIEPNSSPTPTESIQKDVPKVNGKTTPKRSATKTKSSQSITTDSTDKQNPRLRKYDSESDSEPKTPEKRLKIDEKLTDISVPILNQPIDDEPIDEPIKSTEDNNQINDINETKDNSNDSAQDFGVRDEETMETVVETIQEVVPKADSLFNGSVSQINSCDNQKMSSLLRNCIFCIFCDKIFWTVTEAKSHYITHLCPLKCSKCAQQFTSYDEYLDHNSCEELKTPNNIEWCRHYSDSINWIEKFIDFQQTEDIESFESITQQIKNCIVCEKVEKYRPEMKTKIIEIKSIDYSLHLEKHLKYMPQFQCLICLLNCDKYYYCKNSAEAKQHLSKEHSTYETSKPLNYFDGSVPMLDEIMIRFYA